MSEEMVQAVVWHILGIVVGAVGVAYFSVRPLVRGGLIIKRMVREQLAEARARIEELEAGIISLRTEVNCRREHGADGAEHLGYIESRLWHLLKGLAWHGEGEKGGDS